MLKLEKLEMIGFKSFLSRTEFQFHDGITVVVGPNGCGKSNIGDALNWVIGEQSVKSLRGERMEDVIFNGSEARKALGMAEVSLHLRNGQHDPGGDAAPEALLPEKVVISRRLFRSGESEYLINGERSRLRDVQELLVRLNVGSGLYAIIEQGKVDAALSSRPRDRRALIEEAAGVALYKTRRRQAESRLEATEANLLRVNDIVRELEKQLGSLKRQAARARRHGRLSEAIGHQEMILLLHEHGRLDRERREVEEREQSARLVESEASGVLARLEAASEEGLRALEEHDSRWRLQREALHGLQRRIDALEHDKETAGQQAVEAAAAQDAARAQAAQLSARLEEVDRQLGLRRADRAALEQRLAEEGSQQERLEAGLRSQEERIGALEAGLAGARAAFMQVVDSLSEARNRKRHLEELLIRTERREESLDREAGMARADLARSEELQSDAAVQLASGESEAASLRATLEARAADVARLESTLARETGRRDEARRKLQVQQERLRTLQEVEAAPGGTRERLSGLSARDDLRGEPARFAAWWKAQGASGILADDLRAQAGMEAAADAYLRDLLDAAIVETSDDALAGVAALKQAGAGRAVFLPAPGAEQSDAPAIRIPDEVASDPGFLGRLCDLVQTDDARRGALRAALVRAVVVADLDAARRLRRQAPFFDYVTLDGDIVRIGGLIEGGARLSEAAGVLTRRRQMQDLGAAIETGHARVAALETLVAGLGADRSAAQEASDRLEEALSRRERDLVALRLHAQGAAEETSRVRLRTETVAGEKGIAGEEGLTLRTEIERLADTLRDLEEARTRAEAQIAAAQDEIAERRSAAASLNQEHASARAAVAASGQRLESADMDLARLLESDGDLRDRLEAEARRAGDAAQRQSECAARIQQAGEALVALGLEREGLDTAVREGEVALNEMRIGIEQLAQETRAARGRLDQARAAREAITLEKERVASDMRHLEASAPPGQKIEDLGTAISDAEKARTPEETAAQLADLRKRLSEIGPVNMMALDQFRELEQRHGFLSAQRKDLQDALASLKETIARINRTSRERFMETFEAVRAGFQETFRSLFGGGRADLRLMTEEDEDVLDCGLEIVAQPPGKRLGSISLMSGGEKALTAVALLFAIFRHRPSPFCLLDEVDAPLDELNVIRFNEMLRTMATSTQFVMITHNRASMEAADMLYGITMEEPGVSRTMSVVLGGTQERAATVRTLPAILAARHKGTARRAAPHAHAAPREGGNGSPVRTDAPV